jgi:peptidoglycan/LPS O-acetylase OafA/YrhL
MNEVGTYVERPKKTGYLASLDGWRAIAILGVLATHDRTIGSPLYLYMGYGGYGVYLFFAISGFLISTRILEEERLTGHFDIRRFYIRRVLRIQPAALAYLGAAALLMLVGIVHDSWFSWVTALFLVNNFTYHDWSPLVITGHFWTLAVEEHFYILLSLTLLIFRRYRLLAVGLLLAAAIVAPTLYWAIDAVFRPLGIRPSDAPRSTEWQIGPLILAAFVAVLMRRAEAVRAVRMVLRPWVAFFATPVLMVAHNTLMQWVNHAPRVSPFRYLKLQVDFVAFYVLILWVVATVFHPASLTTRLLETRLLRFIGRISYSLYLWHVMIFYLLRDVLFGANGPLGHLAGHRTYILLERPFRLALSFGVATLSYYYIEKPLIRIGHKLAPPATPGRPELADLPVEARG